MRRNNCHKTASLNVRITPAVKREMQRYALAAKPRVNLSYLVEKACIELLARFRQADAAPASELVGS